MAGVIRYLIWNLFLDRIGRKIGMILGAATLALGAVLYLGGKEYEQRVPRLVTVQAEIVAVDFTCTMRAPPTANGRVDGIYFNGSCSDAEVQRRANPGRRFTEVKRSTWVEVTFVTESGATVEARARADDLGLAADEVNAGDRVLIAYDRARATSIHRPPAGTADRWLLYALAATALIIVGMLAWVLDGFGGLDRMRRTAD